MGIDTILLAVGPGDADRAEALARAAREVAGPTDAEVVLLHVFTDEEFETTVDRLGFDPGADPDEVAGRHATVRTLREELTAAGVPVSVRGAVGAHADLIVSTARDVGADRVYVGGRQRSPAGKAVFGSIAQDVLLNSPAPVTFVRE